MASGFPQYCEVRSAYKPQESEYIAGSVVVVEYNRVGYCSIRFDEDRLVEWLGKRMPQGVSKTNPVYLIVEQTLEGYDVSCVYLKTGRKKRLWSQAEIPEWAVRIEWP